MSKALVQTLLQDGMAAAKQGNVELARQSFAKVVQHDPDHEYGWLWLALVVASSEQSIYCLHRVLELNPTNERAKSALNHLQGTIGPKVATSKTKSPNKRKKKTSKRQKVEAAEFRGESESDEPDTAELQELSQEATLVATTETAEVRSFKKRIATGKLPGTGPLSLTDEWLPADLLPKLEPIPAKPSTQNVEVEDEVAAVENKEVSVKEEVVDPVSEEVTDENESTLFSNGHHTPSDSVATPPSYTNGVLAKTTPLTDPPQPTAPASKAAIVPVRQEMPIETNKRKIPIVTDSEPPAESPTITPAKGPCILVVDDSQTVRRLVKITLDRLGFNVVEAKDGFEALAQLANQVPDLILLDITMPRMDGYQVCRIVKENGSTRHIPVIMLSGKDGFFDRVKGRLAGATDYVTKPFEPGALYTSIQSHLEKKR